MPLQLLISLSRGLPTIPSGQTCGISKCSSGTNYQHEKRCLREWLLLPLRTSLLLSRGLPCLLAAETSKDTLSLGRLNGRGRGKVLILMLPHLPESPSQGHLGLRDSETD